MGFIPDPTIFRVKRRRGCGCLPVVAAILAIMLAILGG